jgi:formylglycine-generating enzyme required for sulfatase activity
MFTHKKGRLRTVDIWEGAKIFAPDFKKNQKAAGRFLRDEMIDSGIIVERNERLEFWHLSFQEYLAAYEIGSMSDEEQLKVLFEDSRLYKPEWKEVMLLLAGVLHKQGKPRINHLINAIIEKGPKTATQDTLPELACEVGLLGGMVNDLSPYNFEPSHERYKTIVRSVMGIFDKKIFRSIPVQVRIEAADALGRVGDTRFNRKDDLWVRIPAGSFWMGAQKDDPKGRNYDSEAWDEESPVHEVELTEYYIGKYPVTVYQFRQFIEEGGYKDERYWQAGKFGEFEEPARWEDQIQHPTRPVVDVSWFEAKAYALWAGCRLPTEAEWERAARGAGQKYRKYPWGNEEPDKETMNFYDSSIGHPSPVGIFPESCSPEGVIDIAGNIWQWCEDIYNRNAYSKHSRKNPIYAPIYDSGSYRVIRGGSWFFEPRLVRCALRFYYSPGNRYSYLGFRLLRT